MKCRSFKETKLFANIQGSHYAMALLIVALLTCVIGKERLLEKELTQEWQKSRNSKSSYLIHVSFCFFEVKASQNELSNVGI